MKKKFTTLLGLVLISGLSATSQTIAVDGTFSDWDAVPYTWWFDASS